MIQQQRPLALASLALATAAACHRAAAPSAEPTPAPPSPSTAAPSTAAPPTVAPPPRRDPSLYSDTGVTPVRSPEDEQARFRLPPGYRMELVAAEPLVQDPVAIDFDANGRMWVVEMRAYMPNLQGTGEKEPVGRVVVVEDTNDDGVMDRKTVFLDSLVLPRALKVLEHGVLVGAPPNLFFARDTTGDLKADVRTLVRGDYGTLTSNPEHNANGLLWGIDNWIHNANWEGMLRLQPDGSFAVRRTPSLGQWGVSSDDYGRLFRNSNEDPLRADLIPSWYAGRDTTRPSMRGVYEQLTPNVPVWPGHKTPAVNRGYREETMRPDSTLAHYTSAGSPTVYVGDRLPAELRGSVFVTEPAGNLVGRFLIDDHADGTVTARDAYDHAEFVTNTDERFRPVNLATAPDGTLYVVDMYRGIIQHRTYITGYLEQKIRERGMEQPIGLGRVWRVVHASTTRGPRPRLAQAPAAELVRALAHPNGWWRTTAQRLLVERGDRSAGPALREMARTHADDRARLHALWTLDGLAAADSATVRGALADASPHVRAAAVRIAERRLATADDAAIAAVAALVADSAPEVRRQAAASLGELPVDRRERALLDVASRAGADPIVADLVVTALPGRELAFLDRLLAAPTAAAKTTAPPPAATVTALAAAVMRARTPADVQRLLAHVGDASHPRWQRLAVLAGANVRGRRRGPEPAEGGPGGPFGGAPMGPVVTLPARPAGLLAAAASRDTAIAAAARTVADAVGWPGKAAGAAPAARPLTPEEQRRYAAGKAQYAGTCAGCHQAGGTGLANVAKPLVGSKWVLGIPQRLVRIVQHGKEGEMLMPPVGASLSDEQLASVLTYIRRSWGNQADPIDPATVHEIRGAAMGRAKPWTEAELSQIRR